jgi:bacterial leucyl aminopeptidase
MHFNSSHNALSDNILGEEGGMLGSRAVMQSYAKNSVNVLAVMNQDMTGFSPNNVIAVYTDYVDTALTNFIKKLVPVYSDLPLSTDACGYACSDQYVDRLHVTGAFLLTCNSVSARDAGYPAAYVCDENMEDSSPYIHSSKDTVDTVSIPHVYQHAKASYNASHFIGNC